MSRRRRRPPPERPPVPPPSPSHLNGTVTQRLRVAREFDIDAFSFYGDALDADFAYLDDLHHELTELDPDFTPSDRSFEGSAARWRVEQSVIETRHKAAHVRHTAIRDAILPDSPLPARKVMRASWVAVCRFALVRQLVRDMFDHDRNFETLPRLLLKRAMDFAYVQNVTDHHCALALSDKSFAFYSVQLLMTAGGLLCEALDNFGWTESAGTYLEALFLRYCLVVHFPWESEAVGDVDDLGQWQAASGQGSVPAAELFPAPISSAFLDVGERLFFHHMWRSHAVKEMWLANPPGARLDSKLRLDRHQALATWRLQCGLPALGKMLLHLLDHEALAETARTRFATLYPARLIWPGQREQLLFEYPLEAQDARPDAVLFRLRIAHYKALQRMEREADPGRSVAAYLTQESELASAMQSFSAPEEEGTLPEDFPTEGDWLDGHVVPLRSGFDAVKLVDPERTVLLLFEIAFELRSSEVLGLSGTKYFVQHAYVDDRTLEKGRARPCASRGVLKALRKDAQWPLFIAIWNNYTVASPLLATGGTDVVHTTGHLVDALGRWLALLKVTPEPLRVLVSKGFFEDPQWDKLAMPLELAGL